MTIYKVELEGDEMYIEADTKEAAKARLKTFTGEIPDSLLTWTENVELPEDEEKL